MSLMRVLLANFYLTLFCSFFEADSNAKIHSSYLLGEFYCLHFFYCNSAKQKGATLHIILVLPSLSQDPILISLSTQDSPFK